MKCFFSKLSGNLGKHKLSQFINIICCCCPNARSVVSDSETPWTATPQVPLSMGFPRQEYWSQLLFPTQEDLPDPGIEPTSPALAGRFFTTEPPVIWISLFIHELINKHLLSILQHTRIVLLKLKSWYNSIQYVCISQCLSWLGHPSLEVFLLFFLQ